MRALVARSATFSLRMYCNSRFDTKGLSSGVLWTIKYHIAAKTKPGIAQARNISRQPQVTMTGPHFMAAK